MIEEFLMSHGDYRSDRSFKELTTIKMGGKIAHYVEPLCTDDLVEIINYLKERSIMFKVIGNGSNIIAGSNDFDGVVINLKHFDNYEIDNNELYVEAGVLAPYLALNLAKEGLSGFEFASGIPGTIGGLVYMNAGAYKKEIADIVKEVLVLKDGETKWLTKQECEFSYRHSIFQDHPRWQVIAAKFQLEEKDPEEIKALMDERLQRRKQTQPLDMPSAGSVFRNPEGSFAWKYIDELGYRGFVLNGVEVSNKHSNFIVNIGDGRSEDFLKIVYEIQRKTEEKYNLKLVMEVEKFNC